VLEKSRSEVQNLFASRVFAYLFSVIAASSLIIKAEYLTRQHWRIHSRADISGRHKHCMFTVAFVANFHLLYSQPQNIALVFCFGVFRIFKLGFEGGENIDFLMYM
jgi:hypothetical protein